MHATAARKATGVVLALRGDISSAFSQIIRGLRGDEAQALLTRNHLGRIAFSLHDRVDVAPIHYVHDFPWTFGRASAGAKLLALSHNRWCAFEIMLPLGRA